MHTLKKFAAALRAANLFHILLPATLPATAWPLHFDFASYAYDAGQSSIGGSIRMQGGEMLLMLAGAGEPHW